MRLVLSKSTPTTFCSQATKASDELGRIYLRYILCRDLFSTDIVESTIDDIKPTVSLKEIVSFIHREANLSSQDMIELYSSEGYPLHSNELTSTGELMV